ELKAAEADDLVIIELELNDAPDLLVVDAVQNGRDRNNIDAGFMQVLDGLQLDVEQVADLAVGVGGIADAVKLQVDIAQAGFGRLLAEFKALGELNAVGCRLH